MTIRLVVFDAAGTTVHAASGVVQRTMRDVLGAAGLVLRDGATEGVMGLAKPLAIRTLIEGHGRDELLPRVEAIHADFVARMRTYYRHDPGVRAVDGAEATFAKLRASGIRVAIDSGFSRVILDEVLTRLGWAGPEGPVDASIASDEVKRGRPYPDMIDALRARLGAVPYGQVAKIGDTPVDLQEGTMARCGLVVGVLTGDHDHESLAQHPHDQIIPSVAELPDLLDRLGLLPT